MKKLFIVVSSILLTTLVGCSGLPFTGDGATTRVIDEEEITMLLVFVSSERQHCDDESGRSYAETKSELQNSGIKVYSSDCGVITGRLPPSMCGETTLHINLHEIDEREASRAEGMGYHAVASINDDLGYEATGCD